MNCYIALLHYPVYNKNKDVVTTCVTGFDLHDIARTAVTYGIKRYYVVNPLTSQQEFAQRIVDFWQSSAGEDYNWTRAEAAAALAIKSSLEEVKKEILGQNKEVKVVATSARKGRPTISFAQFRKKLEEEKGTYLFLFGTGWGLTEDVLEKADYLLEPIEGPTDYNHLSVRSAVAAILDRLFGK